MVDTELKHLIKMANQIAEHCAIGADPEVAVEKIADHVARFWAPSMKQQLKHYLDRDGNQVNELAKTAFLSV